MFLDFLIVVVGVFIGIQVANWNDERVQRERERLLLAELREEAIRNAEAARSVGEGLRVGAASGRRVLRLAEAEGTVCPDDCWSVIVDLMHASQWQQISSRWTTYEELRRAGLPSDRRIIEAVETLLQTNHRAAQGLEIPPEYRTLVRRMIPIELQDVYWSHCFIEEGGYERYVMPCAPPVDSPPVPATVVQLILGDPRIIDTLREWTSIALLTGNGLVTQPPAMAEDIVAAIDTAAGAP
ncbi:hypothetical protein [Halomonas denitrificans]|nr:hypothetical protein [Halomonas denitrificans]